MIQKRFTGPYTVYIYIGWTSSGITYLLPPGGSTGGIAAHPTKCEVGRGGGESGGKKKGGGKEEKVSTGGRMRNGRGEEKKGSFGPAGYMWGRGERKGGEGGVFAAATENLSVPEGID